MAPKAAANHGSGTNSGIRQLGNGEAVIPSSTRSDGTVRKEIRIKPGYKPPEDAAVYKNRTAEAWKNRGKGGVPGAEAAHAEERDASGSAAANKNAKRREARKRAAAAAQDDADESIIGGNQSDGKSLDHEAENGAIGSSVVGEEKSEDAKEARKLAKKLRQARELQQRQTQGDELLQDQVTKVMKINELIQQLEGLGFDAEGQPKENNVAIEPS